MIEVKGGHPLLLLMLPLAKRIHLSETETADLQAITRKGTHKSRNITRPRTLLLLGAGMTVGVYAFTRVRDAYRRLYVSHHRPDPESR